MSLPNFPSDGQGERIDAVVTSGNVANYKLGVGTVTPGSQAASWAGSATHTADGVVGASDGVIVVRSLSAAAVDKSGSLTSGGTAQQLAAANTTRHYLLIQNIDGSEDMWVSFTGTAAGSTAGSFLIPAKGMLAFDGNYVPTGAVSIVAATTGHKWSALEA